jgi:L-amino acid N-acyltransferase YncA
LKSNFTDQNGNQNSTLQTEDTQAILDIINYNILNSTALYDYNVRSYEQQKKQF